MSRYIDADAMKADLDTIHMSYYGFDAFRQSLKDYVDKQPTADVDEVVHAHNEYDETDPIMFKCSNCGWRCFDLYETEACDENRGNGNRDSFNYCPNCGAIIDKGRMDGEEE